MSIGISRRGVLALILISLAVESLLQCLTTYAGITEKQKSRTFHIMYSLSFFLVELENARTTLLDVFEVSTGVPKWNCHGAISGSAVRAELASHLGAFQHDLAFAKRIEPRPRRRRLCEARD
jgi:hypothetical protein